MQWPLEDSLHANFRGAVKAALIGIIFHYLLLGVVSVPSFLLPAPICLATEVADHTVCGYQAASAGFPLQQQKHVSAMSSAGCLLVSSDFCCFASLDFGLTKVCYVQVSADVCFLENSFLLPILIGELSGELRITALSCVPLSQQQRKCDGVQPN